MKYRLNRKSLEILRALIRAGKYEDRSWTFTGADAADLLSDPPNWTEYQKWFLGIEQGKPDSISESGSPTQMAHADWFNYCFGSGGVANLNALRDIAKRASKAGESDIADAAIECLEAAAKSDADKKPVNGEAMDVAIRFSAPVTITAAAGSKKLPTFDADVYTGGEMKLDGFDVPVVVDLDGVMAPAHPLPILRDHDPKMELGHTNEVPIESGILKARGVISGVGPHVDRVVEASKNGFPWQVSMGADVLKGQRIRAGESAEANGRTWDGPKIIARKTRLKEISFLTNGADDDTSARIAASAAKGSVVKAKKKFVAWAKAHGFKASDLADDAMLSAAKTTYKAAMKCEADDAKDDDEDYEDDKPAKSSAAVPQIQARAAGPNPEATAEDFIKDIRAKKKAEIERIIAIDEILDKYRKDVPADKFAPIAAHAADADWDIHQIECELVKARRPEAPRTFNINSGKGGAMTGMIMCAAAAKSCGISDDIAYEGLDEQSGNIAASLGGMTPHQIIAESCNRLGMHVRPGGIDVDFLQDFARRDKESHRTQLAAHIQAGGATKVARRSIRDANGTIKAAGSTAAGFSTVSLTGVTENLQNKMMLEQYQLQASVVDDICWQRDSNDFKQMKSYRLTAAGDIEPIGPTGELKSISLQDESYPNQVLLKGALLVLKFEDIANDDLGALQQSAQVIGRKCALNREKAVFTTLLSGISTVAPGASVGKAANTFDLWSAGANNFQSGASSALSITSVQKARQLFLQQTDANNDPIGILPDRLLVPPELEGTADNLFQGANLTVQGLALPASGAQAASQIVNLNQHRNKYRPIVSPFLGGASKVPNASATQWMLLCNPAGGMAVVQVVYYRGQRTPKIQQVDTDAAMLGLAYQATYFFGVALHDFRCGQYSAGA